MPPRRLPPRRMEWRLKLLPKTIRTRHCFSFSEHSTGKLDDRSESENEEAAEEEEGILLASSPGASAVAVSEDSQGRHHSYDHQHHRRGTDLDLAILEDDDGGAAAAAAAAVGDPALFPHSVAALAVRTAAATAFVLAAAAAAGGNAPVVGDGPADGPGTVRGNFQLTEVVDQEEEEEEEEEACVEAEAEAGVSGVVEVGQESLPFIPPDDLQSRERLRKEICWLLSNVAADSHAQIEALLSTEGLAEAVCQVLTDGAEKSKREAVWVLANIAENGSVRQAGMLVARGAIAPLCGALQLGNARSVSLALGALASLLEKSPAPVVPVRDLRGRTPSALAIEAVGGLPHLRRAAEREDLHPNPAADMLESYFR